jgi:hypothetical protein
MSVYMHAANIGNSIQNFGKLQKMNITRSIIFLESTDGKNDLHFTLRLDTNC